MRGQRNRIGEAVSMFATLNILGCLASREVEMKVVKMHEVPKEPYGGPVFTGPDVTRQTLVPESRDYMVNIVNFGKGVKTKLHAHDTEQILIVTAGTGIVATEEEKRVVTVGDIIFIPSGEKHWHGATDGSEFSHIFIIGAGANLTQLED